MPELRDLMADVTADLAAVRWPSAEELRRRVRRRRQRTVAAAVALLTAVTAGAASLAGSGPAPPPPPPATTRTPSPAAVEIPQSALLRPGDVGAGPEPQLDGVDAFQRLRIDDILGDCLRQRGLDLLAGPTRYSRGQTHLLGTAASRPSQPFVLAQEIYRLSAPDAAEVFRDLRAAFDACAGVTFTGDLQRPGQGTVKASGIHTWSIEANGFAGDESIVVRHEVVVRNATTGQMIGQPSSDREAYVRVGDLVTHLRPRRGTTADELRRIATAAAGRMCHAASPPC